MFNKFNKKTLIRNYIIDYRSSGLSKDWFSVVATSICNYFVAEAGGGSLLAPMFSKPTLVLNVYPYFDSTFIYSLLSFKQMQYDSGDKISIKELFSTYIWNESPPSGTRLVNNNSKEITSSI